MASCINIPAASNGEPSILFTELKNRTNDREAAKKIWAFVQTPLFKAEFSGLKTDKNGEPLFSEVARVMDLDSILTKNRKEINMASDMGLMDKKGNPAKFSTAQPAMDLAERYNEQASEHIAVVNKTDDGKYETVVSPRTPEAIIEADRDRARASLNRSLLSLLQSLGFNIEFTKDADYAGIFDPKNAEKNAELLKTIIRVRMGEEGLNAIAEEASHLILAGLKDQTLKKRIDAAFTDDVIHRVLGDDYERYRKDYENGTTPVDIRLRDEAEGHVLADILRKKTPELATQDNQGKSFIEKVKNLFIRLWSQAKRMLSNTSEDAIDTLVAEAGAVMQDVVDLIEDDPSGSYIDTDLVMLSDSLKALSSAAEKMQRIIGDGESIVAKRIEIASRTSHEDMTDMRKTLGHIRKEADTNHYYTACYHIISAIKNDLNKIYKDIEASRRLLGAKVANLSVIDAQASVINRVKTVLLGYPSILKTLTTLPKLLERGEIDMDERACQSLADSAAECLEQLKGWEDFVDDARYNTLLQLIRLFHGHLGQAPSTFSESTRAKWESAEMILDHAREDIAFWDGSLFSAGDSRNPLLNILHNIVVKRQSVRNNEINKRISKMEEATDKLHRAGHDTNFHYQYDEKGLPTGFYKGPVDMYKFYKDMKEYAERLCSSDMSITDVEKALRRWFKENTEEIKVKDPNAEGGVRTELRPKAYADAAKRVKLYATPDFNAGWDEAQKEYYAAAMEMKAEMDGLLPEYSRSSKETVKFNEDGSIEVELPTCGTLYNVPQVRKSVSQAFDKDGRGALATVWHRWKSRMAVKDDNLDYGDIGRAKHGAKTMLLSFDETPIKKVPIYYVHRFEDQRDLSTDGTHALNCYIAMAVNYSEMTKLAESMRLLQSYVEEQYEVTQTDAGKPIIDSFRQMGISYVREYRKKALQTRTGKQINTYIDRLIFNETRETLGRVAIPFSQKELDLDQLANTIRWLTSVSRMGLNILSGITNINQGETQMLAEAARKKYFDLKDLGFAKVEYQKLLLNYLGQFNSANRHDRMYLLINQFNSSEDYFRDMLDKDYNKSWTKRILGRGNVYFFNTIGEHYLHTAGMLAVLHNIKVKRLSDSTGKEVSLYDVITTVHDKNGYHLELDDDIEIINKNQAFLIDFGFKEEDPAIIRKEDRDHLFINLTPYINKINADMHGGYSEAEKGNINRNVLARFFLQFRQWMFGMYNKLYSKSYYDEVLGTSREGAFVSLGRAVVGLMQDLKNVITKEEIERDRLSEEEKDGVRLAVAQMSIYSLLFVLSMLTAGLKDEDDRYARLLAYSIRRLELEVGALTIAPNPTGFVKNVFTLLQSPAAAVKTLENLSQVFDLMMWGQTIQSGRFKGWWKPAKALWVSTPFYNIQRLIDMDDYSYMFNIFK